MSGVNATSEKALQEALVRLVEGRPLRRKGDLTVAGLAVEAGVSRSMARRPATAIEAMRALQLRRSSSAELERPVVDGRQARSEINQLRRRHAEKVAMSSSSLDTLAQPVQV